MKRYPKTNDFIGNLNFIHSFNQKPKITLQEFDSNILQIQSNLQDSKKTLQNFVQIHFHPPKIAQLQQTQPKTNNQLHKQTHLVPFIKDQGEDLIIFDTNNHQTQNIQIHFQYDQACSKILSLNE